jgi:hypothetical protein
MFNMYNKQWRRLVTVLYINEFNRAVDDTGVEHDLQALRPARTEDQPLRCNFGEIL